MTELSIARECVKRELRRNGIKLSHVDSEQITKAAKALLQAVKQGARKVVVIDSLTTLSKEIRKCKARQKRLHKP